MDRYIAVTWHHDFADEPVELISEVIAGIETRKVEKFRAGLTGLAGPGIARRGTQLSEGVMPSDEEIAADPQFTLRTITRENFEAEWREAMRQ